MPFSGRTGVEVSAVNPRPGESWRTRRGCLQTMWTCPYHCLGVTGPSRSPRRMHLWQRCWPPVAAGMAHCRAILWRDRCGRVGDESWAHVNDLGSDGVVEP
jgi:hypothetical protein